jgi:hypothetical protein
MGSLGTVEVAEIIAATVAIVSGIFHAALYIGKLSVRIERHEDRLNDHDERIDRLVEQRHR